jgi:tRNA pseudouridine38-40 synthase
VSRPARRIRLDLAYDGSDFAGWQRQRAQRTVQGVLEETLAEIQGGGRRVVLRAAGRTDAGVHARHQVADAEIASRLTDSEFERALRQMLPGDVRPLSLRTVDGGFHSQKHALSKTYCYRLDLSPAGDPFETRYALHHPHPFDARRVEAALGGLPGRRDWSGFAASACTKLDRVRTMTEAHLARLSPTRVDLVFSADGFLQHMVRNLVGTLLEIGGGRMPPETIEQVLESRDRRRAGPTAPAHGLVLVRVDYPDERAARGPRRL